MRSTGKSHLLGESAMGETNVFVLHVVSDVFEYCVDYSGGCLYDDQSWNS